MLLATCLLQTALAYDSAKLEDALDSLSAASFPAWKKRARAGDPVAQNVVGMACKYGEVTAQNPSSSLHWFLKAARQGDADAQFNLGRIYGKATGSVYGKQRAAPQDDVAAAHWYQSAAEQDYGPAQRNLADMYAEGSQTIPRDRTRAVFWLKRAAAAGDLAASRLAEKLGNELTAFEKQGFQTMETQWSQRRHISP
ncbi:MAG: tetratricopeptide repeat protein [Aquabacterium sp.]|nr:tetratricopeptide repeat protein [Aquabacterium sp.]